MQSWDDVQQAALSGRVVLVRLDLNVPILHDSQDGAMPPIRVDRSRILAAWPTLQALLAQGARVVVLAHWGRPTPGFDAALSLNRLQPHLEEAWPETNVRVVPIVPDCPSRADLETLWQSAPSKTVVVLDNLRFCAGEEANDPLFAQKLASLGDAYVNDAFSVSHRAHASVVGVPSHLPAYAGLSVRAEVNALDRLTRDPARPMLAVVGGAKISTKLEVVLNLTRTTDMLALGGAMVHPFWQAQGYSVGLSKTEAEGVAMARAVLESAAQHQCRLLIPCDGIAATSPQGVSSVVLASAIPEDMMVLDMGPQSLQALVEAARVARTVVWNGPLGLFEHPPFDQATTQWAQALAMHAEDQFVVAGGGDTVAALNHAALSWSVTQPPLLDCFSYISNAGGAFLEWLEGRSSPGVEALRNPRGLENL